VNAAGFDCGPTLTSKCNYLEVALSDDANIWCGLRNNNVANSAGTAIGTGYRNTIAIVDAGCSPSVAATARAINAGGLTDWYLPSTAELTALRSTKSALDRMPSLTGARGPKYYWSSTRATQDASALYYSFDTGQISTGASNYSRSVRPIRAF